MRCRRLPEPQNPHSLHSLPDLKLGFADTHFENGYLLTHELQDKSFKTLLQGPTGRTVLSQTNTDLTDSRACFVACKDLMQTVEADLPGQPTWYVLTDTIYAVTATSASQARLKTFLATKNLAYAVTSERPCHDDTPRSFQ